MSTALTLPELPYSVVGWDVETHAFTDADKVRDVVCGTYAGREDTLELAQEIARALGHLAELNVCERMFVSRKWGMGKVKYWTLLVLGPEATTEVVRIFASQQDLRLASHYGVFDHTCVLRHAGHDVRDPHADPEPARELFGWLEDGTLAFTDVREQLYCIARDWFRVDPRLGNKPTKWSLAHIVAARWGEDLSVEKTDPDSWRLRYHLLDGVPLAQWPARAKDYAIMDAVWAMMVYLDQARPYEMPEGVVVHPNGYLQDEVFQTKFAMPMYWMGVTGLTVDPDAVREFEQDVRREVEKANLISREMGFWKFNTCKTCDGTGMVGDVPHLEVCPVCKAQGKPRKKPGKSMTRLQDWVTHFCGGVPPMTPTGRVSTSTQTLQTHGDQRLKDFAELNKYQKLLSTYIPQLLQAASAGRLTSRPNPLVRSKRTSWTGPNLQNPPRKGRYRECFVARPGRMLASIDYSFIELCALATVCHILFGYSRLGDVINSGKDPHLAFAAVLLGIPYEEAARRRAEGDPLVGQARQEAKAANFGFPGGMWVDTFLETYGDAIVAKDGKSREQRAEEIREKWLDTYPEVREYFEWHKALVRRARGGRRYGPNDPKPRFAIWQHGAEDGRGAGVRGGCTFTSSTNGRFQGLAAAGIKEAVYRIAKEAHTAVEGDPLWGVRLLLMIHDETMPEGPEETAHIWAPRISELMVEAMREFTPKVEVKAPPALMPRWYKAADPVYVDGKLVPWEPGDTKPEAPVVSDAAKRNLRREQELEHRQAKAHKLAAMERERERKIAAMEQELRSYWGIFS